MHMPPPGRSGPFRLPTPPAPASLPIPLRTRRHQLPDVGQPPGYRRCRCHCRRHQMGPCPGTLSSYEISIRGGSTTFAARYFIGVHWETHRATGLTPLESGLDEDAVEPLFLGLALDQSRARDDQRLADAVGDMAPLDHCRGGAQI